MKEFYIDEKAKWMEDEGIEANKCTVGMGSM